MVLEIADRRLTAAGAALAAWTPPVAARLSPERIALGRAAGRWIPPLALGGGLALQADPLGPVGFDATSVLTVRLGDVDADTIALALSPGAHRTIAAAVGAPAEAAQEDREAAALMAEAAFEQLLDAAEAVIGTPLAVADWSIGAPEGDRIWIAGRLIDGDGARTRLAIGAAAPLAQRLAGWLAAVPARPRNDRFIGLAARVRFPPVVLSRAALQALRPGDTIFDELTLSDLRLQIGPAQWRCAMSDNGVTKVGDAFDSAPEAASTEAELVAWSADGETADAPLDARLELADVVLSVELARATVPLEEARRVGPGYVLPLGREIGSDVDLMIAEKRFGRGRLVEIDGEIAVEIVRLG